MGDFGSEFINVLPIGEASVARDEQTRRHDVRSGELVADMDISNALTASVPGVASGTKRTLYFPPGTYRLERSVDFGPSVELYFSPGATLFPLDGVKVTIRGRIRAGLFQIFGLMPNRSLTGYNRVNGVRTVPPGMIRLWSKQIDTVPPEWFGADPRFTTDGFGAQAEATTVQYDSWDSLQAAINAACRDRVILDANDRPLEQLPPLPVRVGGIYQTSRTLVAVPGPGSATAGLVLRGTRGLASAGDGLPSIFSVRLSGVGLDDTQWTVRIEPGVSFELSDLVLDSTINVWGALGIQCGPADGVGRRGTCRRCTFRGTERAVVRIHEPVYSSLVRHFYFDDVRVEQKFERSHLPPVAGGPPGEPMVGLALDAGESTMVRVHNTWMVDEILPSTIRVPPNSMNVIPLELPADARIQAVGGSMLVDACTFSGRSGPRPSRPGLNDDQRYFDRPDGQDVFVGRREGSPVMTHLTLLQIESQGWWLLGRKAGLDDARHQGPTLLLFVKHVNINYGYGPGHPEVNLLARLERWPGANPRVPVRFDVRGLPSIAWPTTNTPGAPIVLVASRLGSFVGLSTAAAALDVGTTYLGLGVDQPNFYLSLSVAYGFPPRQFRSPSEAENFTLRVPHLVPLRPAYFTGDIRIGRS